MDTDNRLIISMQRKDPFFSKSKSDIIIYDHDILSGNEQRHLTAECDDRFRNLIKVSFQGDSYQIKNQSIFKNEEKIAFIRCYRRYSGLMDPENGDYYRLVMYEDEDEQLLIALTIDLILSMPNSP